jgi:hypothetical protein
MKKNKFAIIIALLLFFIPFFWLGSGEMNLGGDSGRLYFYDPAGYLKLRVLYNYLGSGIGIELVYYIYLPYVVFLLLLELVFQSPTILISLFNGLTLSVAFFSVYLFVKELCKTSENAIRSGYVESASILAGLFYIFSQHSIYSGWEKPIIAFHQLFLNPFMAFILLKLMLTQKIRYMITALLTTFIFTPNFSVVGAPPFFAFYPLTIIFLFIYAKFVRKINFRWNLFGIGIVLFLLIHSFHLVNSIENVFSSGSSYNQAIFAQEGEEGSRNAVSYFIAVASSLKVGQIWMGLQQDQSMPYFAVFIIFPLVLVVSFFLNRGKTLLLTGLFFLITFFFASAITEVGFNVYKQLFKIPGFSIFRNFHGQWLYVFLFFYSLILGQAIAIAANNYSKRIAILIFTIFTAVIVGFGFPLLTGSIPMPTREDTGERHVFRMDPKFEQVLQNFKSEPIDGKVLMFPLTGFGYQVLQGKDGGLYKGLPMISYLAGKSEFGGYGTLEPFQNIFMTSMKNRDLNTLKKLISVMNVKWIFHNSDPYIYSDQFMSTYGYVLKFSPENQNEYKKFTESLPVTKLADFGDKYHIYKINDDVYLPHIYATNDLKFTNGITSLMFDSSSREDVRHTILSVEGATSKEDQMILYGIPNTFLLQINNNIHLHKHLPFLSRKPSDLIYHFVSAKEKFDLFRYKRNQNQYLDYALFLLSKRIAEIESFGDKMSIGVSSWQEPRIWEIHKWFSYNSLNSILIRYEIGVNEIIDWIRISGVSEEEQTLRKIKVNEQLYQHELALLRTIRNFNKKDSEKRNLLIAVNNMYDNLFRKINISKIDPSMYAYRLPAYANHEGTYQPYLQNKDIENQNQNEISLKLSGETLKTPFPNIKFDFDTEMEVLLTMPIFSLVEGEKWENSGSTIENADGVTTMILNNKLGDRTSGLTLNIPNWTAESVYLISFDFKTNGDDFIFSFVDKRPSDSINKFFYQLFFEKRLNAKSFKTHQSIIFAEPQSIGGFLKIVPFFAKDESTIQIKNLIVQKVDYPKLAFKKLIPEEVKNQLLPHLTFTKINPTRYVIDVKEATDPYMLVFQESFSKNWKLFNIESNTESVGGSIARFFGNVGKLLVGNFVKNKAGENAIAASYFNGEIKEGESANIFIDSQTFETWGKNTVSDYAHIRANEYANAWYITPDDMGGKKDYKLILELKTQKRFYPMLLISLLTIICIIGYVFRKFIWSIRQ